MKKFIFFILLFIICLILTLVGSLNDIKFMTFIGSVASTILGSMVSIIFDAVYTQNQGIKLWFSHIRYYNKDIRLSFSYLYRIQVDGKYLLVRGNRLKNQYQPVGGVYKYYDEAKPALENFNYTPDICMKNDRETDDLRIQIQGKYLLKFINWFLSMDNREYDPSREFNEELIETKLLPMDEFKKINYRKILVHNRGVTYSKYNKCNEFIYADIFELKLTEKQKQVIREAVENNPESLCLASKQELINMCHGGIEKNIGNHAKWLIGEYDE